MESNDNAAKRWKQAAKIFRRRWLAAEAMLEHQRERHERELSEKKDAE